MKRDAALLPLTHDHHHALAHARRLRIAGQQADASARLEAAQAFVSFFREQAVAHFREEEELVFPLLLKESDHPPELLIRALVEHVRMHAMMAELAEAVERGFVEQERLVDFGTLLEAHVRLEERQLFPLIEQTVPEPALRGLPLMPRQRTPAQPA